MIKKNKSLSHGQISIIGGIWKGRKLPVFDSDGLRPTTSKIRETLFNWLTPILRETRCLDCFAGSGALAIEALSRHVASATLIELNHAIATQLSITLANLKAKNAKIIYNDALHYLSQEGTAYDIIFLDPPFRANLLEQTAWLLEKNGWLTKTCWIYVETDKKNHLEKLPTNWKIHRKKHSGQVNYCLYIRHQ